MSVRTSFLGIGVAGALVAGLVAGLVRAQETAPPSLGNTIEVTSPPSAGDGEALGTADALDGATAASLGPASPPPPPPADAPDTAIIGSRAVAPPVSSGDDGDDSHDDDPHGDGDGDDGDGD